MLQISYMRILRKAFALRFVLIYLPLIVFFGWRAVHKYQQQHASELPSEQTLPGQTRTIELPDGRTLNVIEVSPEEAKDLFGMDVSPSE